jgi:mannose-6-phosphate isomerase
MLVALTNTPRDYEWGSREAIARLQGRAADGTREAEVWFGDHPGAPARVEDGTGRTLDVWIAEEGAAHGTPAPLPFLLKLLAAESPLSIQAHPTRGQAREGFRREERAGVSRDASHRNYRDDNHKPEVIVAIDGDFEALAGFRPSEELAELLGTMDLPDDVLPRLRAGLRGPDAEGAIRAAVGDLLSGRAADAVRAIERALVRPHAPRFADDLAAVARIAARHPGDPGIAVALMMNRVVLAEGEAMFVPAGVPHAYLRGLGVEIMAASDNVLRGGLTPKYVDVPELLDVIDARPGPVPRLVPEHVAPGVELFAPPVPDFSLVRVRRDREDEPATTVRLRGATIALATRGSLTVAGGSSELALAPGQACLLTPDEGSVRIGGAGELFLARSGEASSD